MATSTSRFTTFHCRHRKLTTTKGFTFLICNHKQITILRGWIDQLNALYGNCLNRKTAIEHIRSLAFPFFDCFPATPSDPVSGDLIFAAQCPNLNHLSIKFHAEKLVKRDVETSDLVTKSADELRSEHNLDRLLKMKGLTNIYLCGMTNRSYYGAEYLDGLYEVHRWLQKEFDAQVERKERNSKVQVKLFGLGGIWQYE